MTKILQGEINGDMGLKLLDYTECLSRSFLDCSIYIWVGKKWTIPSSNEHKKCFMLHPLFGIQNTHEYIKSSEKSSVCVTPNYLTVTDNETPLHTFLIIKNNYEKHCGKSLLREYELYLIQLCWLTDGSISTLNNLFSLTCLVWFSCRWDV